MKKCYNNEIEQMFITDKMGMLMWESISDNSTFETILESFFVHINDEKTDELVEMISNDIQNFLQVLLSQNMIEEVI